jgi:hypothetical protein
VGADELCQFTVQRVDLPAEAAEHDDLLARDPHPRAAGRLPQRPVDPVEHPRLFSAPRFSDRSS